MAYYCDATLAVQINVTDHNFMRSSLPGRIMVEWRCHWLSGHRSDLTSFNEAQSVQVS